MWRGFALFIISFAALCVVAASDHASGKQNLRLVNDPVAGVRIGIPADIPVEGKPSKWGRSWSSRDGTIAINTLAFAPGRPINDIYERLSAIKGRVLKGLPRLSQGAFVLEGRDADGMAFYITARQDGTIVRGVSIIYPDARQRESADLVRRIAQSFTLLSDAGDSGTSKVSSPSANCAAEQANLERAARGVIVTISPPGDLSVGGKIAVRWQAASSFPGSLPVYLIFTMPEEVRIESVVASGLTAEKPVQAKSALKGYIALPHAARAPQDIAFGKGGARVFVPFHQPGSMASGSFSILPYRAGPWPMGYAIVARTACGERFLTSTSERTFAVNLGTPKLVIQDPFPLEAPDRIIVSNSGAYSLHVFKNRYRVFDTVTGALLVERAGSAPNFSPTSRYLTAASGGANARGFKQHDVIDLVTGEVIAQTGGLLIGWSHGDAFLFDADQDWGLASAYQPLVSNTASNEPSILPIADSPMSCHACKSSSEAAVRIDIDLGIIAFFNTQSLDENKAEFCELSGAKCSTAISLAQLDEIIRRNYGVDSFSLPAPKESWTALAYSHVDEENPANRLRITPHNQQVPGGLPLSQTDLRLVKAGDWRSTVRPRSVTASSVGGKGYLDQLDEFGISVAGLSELIVQWPTPEWARAEKSGIDRYDKAGTALYAQEFAKLKHALLADFPEMDDVIGPGSDFPYEGKLEARQKIDLEAHLLGAWRLVNQAKPVWIVQVSTVEGSGGFGHGALFLIDGRKARAERLIGAERGLDGSMPAGEVDQTRFQVRIAGGRYLLYSALINKEIHLYDIDKQTALSRIPVPSDSDLQFDLRVTKDHRHVLQMNSDGQLFLYETATAKRLLSGWFVDDEMLVYTQEGYFRSSYEGATLVHVKFPGIRGLHSLQQFASQLDNPAIIKDLLAGAAAPAKPILTPPPRLKIELVRGDGKQPTRLVATASATGEMRSLRVFADGQPFETIEVKGASIKEDVSLSDTDGARLLTVLAVDDRGLVSQPQSVNLAAPSRQHSTLFGVFIGVNKYADPQIPRLSQAVSDATNAEAAFKLAAAKTYAEVKTSLLTDERASPLSLKSAIESIAVQARPEDTFVLFFAGHGLQSREGKFYLTSTSFKLNDPDGTGISWSDLASALSKVKARVVLLIDACHSGSIGAQLATNDSAVADLLQGSGRPLLVFAAAKGRQFSYESANIKGGYFTYFLCRILTTDRARYDLNQNGVLEISELYLALKEQVSRKVWDQERGSQTPWLARRDMIGDFGLF